MRFRHYCMSFLCSIVAMGLVAGERTAAQERTAVASENPQVELRTGSELADYVALPDENYRWELREQQTIQNCDVLRLHLTSQRWHGIDWEFSQVEGGVTLDVTTRGPIDTVRGWVAVADTRDFRDARWIERACQSTGQGAWQLAAATPPQGFMACFAECVSDADTMPAFFSTNVRIFSAQK